MKTVECEFSFEIQSNPTIIGWGELVGNMKKKKNGTKMYNKWNMRVHACWYQLLSTWYADPEDLSDLFLTYQPPRGWGFRHFWLQCRRFQPISSRRSGNVKPSRVEIHPDSLLNIRCCSSTQRDAITRDYITLFVNDKRTCFTYPVQLNQPDSNDLLSRVITGDFKPKLISFS